MSEFKLERRHHARSSVLVRRLPRDCGRKSEMCRDHSQRAGRAGAKTTPKEKAVKEESEWRETRKR